MIWAVMSVCETDCRCSYSCSPLYSTVGLARRGAAAALALAKNPRADPQRLSRVRPHGARRNS